MTFGMHNHWWEFLQVEGRYAYQVMLDWLDPDIFFEIDTYWVQTAGVDPAQVIRELGARVPILHIKDGPCVKCEPMTAVGDGVMDFHAVVKAGEAVHRMVDCRIGSMRDGYGDCCREKCEVSD